MPTIPPDTRASLILRLPNARDAAAWDEFETLYRPVIYRAARRSGLQPADAEDCVQEVLCAVASAVSRWLEREDRGPFRSWLFRITRNNAIDFLTRRKHRAWSTGGSAATAELARLPEASDPASDWDIECRREVYSRASAIVREKVSEKTWEAFHRTTVLDQGVAAVASQLDMSPGSVYIARCRVMNRLQEIVDQMKESFFDEV